MPFKKGNTEHKKASKARDFAAMLKIAVKEAHGDGNKLRAIADALVREAIDGNVQAIKEVADRIDGKVPQPKEHSGPDGGEIPHRLIVETSVVSAKD